MIEGKTSQEKKAKTKWTGSELLVTERPLQVPPAQIRMEFVMSSSRKALCVGINQFKNYPNAALQGCVNDAKAASINKGSN